MYKMLEPILERLLDGIKERVPSDADVDRLGRVMEQKQSDYQTRELQYIVETMFINCTGFIPNKFPALKKDYFDLALSYFENFDLEERGDDPIIQTMSNMSIALFCLYEYVSSTETNSLDDYEAVAKEIINFYTKNMEDIQSLGNTAKVLFELYSKLNNQEDLRKIAAEHNMDIDPSKPTIIRDIWEKAKEMYKGK